jgi:TolB-like protein
VAVCRFAGRVLVMRNARWVRDLVLVLVLGWQPVSSSAQAPPNRVALLGFSDYTERPEFVRLAAGLPDLIGEELSNATDIAVVERSSLEAVLKELNLQMSGAVNQSSMSTIGRMLGANEILFGGIYELGDQVRISIRLVDVESAQIKSSCAVDFTRTRYLNNAHEVLKELFQNVMFFWYGSLAISANVQSQVFVNDQYAGVTPLTLSQLKGSYIIRLSAGADYEDQSRTINIKPGERESWFVVMPMTLSALKRQAARTEALEIIDKSLRRLEIQHELKRIPGKIILSGCGGTLALGLGVVFLVETTKDVTDPDYGGQVSGSEMAGRYIFGAILTLVGIRSYMKIGDLIKRRRVLLEELSQLAFAYDPSCRMMSARLVIRFP